ncbi:MAG: hypothetical protein IJC61_04030, partial [Oscillospiraceae bacterium]|nr:hypothetical protein [Oscillospiraceae bacterium]
MATVRIMTHNLWKNDRNRPAWQQQGFDCSAEVRIPLFARLYSETLPDALCLQEVSPHMAQLLVHALCEKQLPYCFAEGGDTPILYRTDRFSLLHSEFSRYPEQIPALTGRFNNYGSKSYCIAVLQHRESGRVML